MTLQEICVPALDLDFKCPLDIHQRKSYDRQFSCQTFARQFLLIVTTFKIASIAIIRIMKCNYAWFLFIYLVQNLGA